MINIAKLKYTNPEQTNIDMEVTIDEGTANQYVKAGDVIPFHYVPGDNSPVALAVRDALPQYGGQIGAYTPPPPPPEVFKTLSDVQLFTQLATGGYINNEEALAAVSSGDLPALFINALNNIGGKDKFQMQIKLQGATTFAWGSDLAKFVQTAMAAGDEDFKQFWRAASAL